MAVKAYILIETAAGKIDNVLKGVRGLPGVKEADSVTGPYDVICVIEAEDLSALGNLVKTRIQGIAGVNHTITCLSVG